MTIEEMLDTEIPAPFVRGQVKKLGDCTVGEVKEAIRVLEVTTEDTDEIDFLRTVVRQLKVIEDLKYPIRTQARYSGLLSLVEFREGQIYTKKGK